MKCLVTGATASLESNVVYKLVIDEWDICSSGMPGSDTKNIKDLAIEIVFADITIVSQLEELVRG
jgi:hypothetical protein